MKLPTISTAFAVAKNAPATAGVRLWLSIRIVGAHCEKQMLTDDVLVCARITVKTAGSQSIFEIPLVLFLVVLLTEVLVAGAAIVLPAAGFAVGSIALPSNFWKTTASHAKFKVLVATTCG